MHRAILLAWLPWFLWLLAAVGAVWLVLRFSGARLALGKIRRLHRCESGSVQTLSFVVTLPIFILLLMFIVQVAELMVGIAVVNYAAFAAARAASVWIPAETRWYPSDNGEGENMLDPSSFDREATAYPMWVCGNLSFNNFPPDRVWKYRKVWSAAAIACAPLSPSRDLTQSSKTSYMAENIKAIYPSLVPSSMRYPRIQQLIQKKLDYSARNTFIIVTGRDDDGSQPPSGRGGPTYNPYPGYYGDQIDRTTGQRVWIPWNPQEVGWEDPITVRVIHQFALLPGPGRFLATALSSPDGTPDRVSPLISRSTTDRYQGDSQNAIRLYYVVLSADVTLSNEGFKSTMPYVQPKD